MTIVRAGAVTTLVLAGAMALAHLFGIPLMLTSWASSAALIAGFRTSPAARPAPAAIGHVVSGAIGAILISFSTQFSIDAMLLAPVGAGLAVMAMMLARNFHPPAAANAAIPLVSDVVTQDFALAIICGALGLAAMAALCDRIDGAKP